MKLPIIALTLTVSAFAVLAQNGDKAGEEQKLLVPEHLIPPSPVLSPGEALKAFTIKPGFRVELVAAEPLVNTPVAMEFDPDGRIWVVEMIGYMPDPDGTGEKEPSGRIVVLEDTDGDGRMDKRTVFLDGLVLPRAIGLARGGVIVAEMPNLWFCEDRDGDLKCDEKTRIATDYVQGDINNPEHNANALMLAMDNWIYSANYTKRIRFTDGRWEQGPTVFRGQWGLSQDNFGRLVYDTNSDQLRIDLIPAEYYLRNPDYNSRAGVNVDPVRNQKTFPVRVTPGINRGYQPQMLDPQGRLSRFTAACGPVIYRGDNFPAEFLGNAFVCEPSGNLIKRNILKDDQGIVTGEQAYPDSEFLASTDERFRPVNAYNGPDGALYLVDMYRGLIQHKIYLTSYLRQQVESRELQKPTDHGRIYRIVHEGAPLTRTAKLSGASSTELARALQQPNGWTRDTAQRLLVERADVSVVPALQRIVRSDAPAAVRVQALWTLSGMNQADVGLIRAALLDKEPKVQVAALQVADAHPAVAEAAASDIIGLWKKAGFETRWQLALTLGNFQSNEALAALTDLAVTLAGNDYIQDAVLSGVHGREVKMISGILERKPAPDKTAALIRKLGFAVFKGGNPDAVIEFLAVAGQNAGSQPDLVAAMLVGARETVPGKRNGQPAPKIKAIALADAPAGLAALQASGNPKIVAAVEQVEPLISWKGKSQEGAGDEVRPLNDAEQALFNSGKELYAISCGACHQPHGNGQEGLAPPLAGSEWVLGSDEKVIRIALHGLMGPIEVKDQKWDLIMPGLGIFEDDQLAGILTYIRREWGNTADPVTPERVKAIRDKYPDRIDLWTAEELSKLD